ncbi:MAG: BadF/BadG/BcrA/BcrD ATPase family protein [Lacisediminihabitans sp.]
MLDTMVPKAKAQRYVVAVDSGGTHTRVGCFDLDGSLLSSVSGRGGSPFHNRDAEENVKSAVRQCLVEGGLDPADAVAVGAGLAEIRVLRPNEDDAANAWAEGFFSTLPSRCPRVIVNDAVTAHRGALLGRPGVIVVGGTGSMILAVTGDGAVIESGRFEHYAGGARHLAFEAMQLIFTGVAEPDDADFVANVLEYWGAGTVSELRGIVLELAALEDIQIRRRYGLLAPLITAWANTSPLADRVLNVLVEKTVRGVLLLAPLLGDVEVSVATAGALATDSAFRSRLSRALAEQAERRVAVAPTALDPLRGAALLACEAAGIVLDDEVIRRLGESQRSFTAASS